MNTQKTTPIITGVTSHNVKTDVNRALEILELDPVQGAKLLQRAINNLISGTRLARRTQLVTVPNYLFTDENHPIFTPHYTTLD